jgi:hypothetical protein
MNDPQYPTGKFVPKTSPLTDDERASLVDRIRAAPAELRAAVEGLSDSQLDTPYREGGWSPRQITHHVADSHLNAFVRFKLGVTESKPTIKPYDQAEWAKLADSTLPIASSLGIVDGLHLRWVHLLESFAPADFTRALIHPEFGEIDLDYLLQMYAWHGRHHATQVSELRTRSGW